MYLCLYFGTWPEYFIYTNLQLYYQIWKMLGWKFPVGAHYHHQPLWNNFRLTLNKHTSAINENNAMVLNGFEPLLLLVLKPQKSYMYEAHKCVFGWPLSTISPNKVSEGFGSSLICMWPICNDVGGIAGGHSCWKPTWTPNAPNVAFIFDWDLALSFTTGFSCIVHWHAI